MKSFIILFFCVNFCYCQNNDSIRYEKITESIINDTQIKKSILKNISRKKRNFYENDSLQFSITGEIHSYGILVSILLKDTVIANKELFLKNNDRDSLILLYRNQKFPIKVNKELINLSNNLNSNMKLYFSESIKNTLACELALTLGNYQDYNITPKKRTSILIIYFFNENNDIINKIVTTFDRVPLYRFLETNNKN